MREKLIELIKNGIEEHQSKVAEDIRKTVYNNHRDNSKTDNICNIEETLADYLLANGVVVLPCKVGDTVYCIEENNDIYKTIVITIHCTVRQNFCQTTNGFLDLNDFGKTVFLTKEEAEKALERRKSE